VGEEEVVCDLGDGLGGYAAGPSGSVVISERCVSLNGFIICAM
jgi:hypothetical protein